MSLPRNSEGRTISFPSWLLEEMDAYCDHEDITCSALVARAVRKFLWSKKESIEKWDHEYNEHSNS